MFTPSQSGERRVLLEKTTVGESVVTLLLGLCCKQTTTYVLQPQVKDPRFEWTRDKMLILKEVTHQDEGLYSVKMSSGFTYETVHLTVSGILFNCYHCGINI